MRLPSVRVKAVVVLFRGKLTFCHRNAHVLYTVRYYAILKYDVYAAHSTRARRVTRAHAARVVARAATQANDTRTLTDALSDPARTKHHEIGGLNCHDSHTRVMQPGDELHYGWALGPGEVRYQHRWLVRDGQVLDLFNWTAHEDLGKVTPCN